MTARMMKFVFKSWSRVKFVNKYFAGTVLPRIQLDYIPSMKSSAHFAIISDKELKTVGDYIEAGRVIQRFWLQSERLNLGFQPEQTPVIFSRYIENGLKFTEDKNVEENALKGKKMFEDIVDSESKTVFLGRLGRTNKVTSRSLRKPLKDLIIK